MSNKVKVKVVAIAGAGPLHDGLTTTYPATVPSFSIIGPIDLVDPDTAAVTTITTTLSFGNTQERGSEKHYDLQQIHVSGACKIIIETTAD